MARTEVGRTSATTKELWGVVVHPGEGKASAMATLCIDGGGTKTAALLVAPDGAVCGCGVGGALAFVESGGDVVRRSARDAVCGASADAAEAGVDCAADQAILVLGGGNADEAREAVSQAAGGIAVQITGEPQAAAALGRAAGYDAVVLAGTGVVSVGLDGDDLLLCGGLGVLLGDEGSGFDIGWQAIRAVLRSMDGRGPETSLAECICRRLLGPGPATGATVGSHRRDLAGGLRFAALSATRAQIAALAPMVSETAASGDVVSCEILDRAGRELALNGIALVRRLRLRPASPCIAGLGGVFRAGPALRDAFRRAVERSINPVDVVLPDYEVILGAALLGVAEEPKAAERLLAEWPVTQARLRLRAGSEPGEGDAGPSIRDSLAAVQ